MNLIDANSDKLKTLCKKHKVTTLFAFGSIVSEKFNTDSDIDLIVDFGDVDLYEYADNYFSFKFALEDIFNREVDLLEEKAINNPYFRKSVNATRKLIYG